MGAACAHKEEQTIAWAVSLLPLPYAKWLPLNGHSRRIIFALLYLTPLLIDDSRSSYEPVQAYKTLPSTAPPTLLRHLLTIRWLDSSPSLSFVAALGRETSRKA